MRAARERARCVAPTGAERTRFGEKPLYDEGLWELGHGVYAWLVPNGSWGEANAGLVVGEGQSVLIETLWDLPKTRAMLEAMEPFRASAPITTVINTHGDGDHFFGNQLLPEAETVTSRSAARQMAHNHPRAMGSLARLGGVLGTLPFGSARDTGHWIKAMGAPYDFAGITPRPADHSFEGELELERGGRGLRLIEVGPAHTEGDLLAHVPGAGVLFAGDILFIGSTPAIWAGPLKNWLRALDLIERLAPEIIVPGHGPLTDLSGVAQVRGYWEFVAEAARARFAQGLGADAAARDIAAGGGFAAAGYLQWDSPERLAMNCHMLYREFQGVTGAPSTAQILNMLRSQAVLAHTLPNTRPASMRRNAAGAAAETATRRQGP